MLGEPLFGEETREAGHERSHVGSRGITAGPRGGVSVAGQAQGQHPMGPGKRGNDPPPAGGALLVTVHQQQRRPGPGLQDLGVHPSRVIRRSRTANSRRAWGSDVTKADVEMACVEMTDKWGLRCAVMWATAASPGPERCARAVLLGRTGRLPVALDTRPGWLWSCCAG